MRASSLCCFCLTIIVFLGMNAQAEVPNTIIVDLSLWNGAILGEAGPITEYLGYSETTISITNTKNFWTKIIMPIESGFTLVPTSVYSTLGYLAPNATATYRATYYTETNIFLGVDATLEHGQVATALNLMQTIAYVYSGDDIINVERVDEIWSAIQDIDPLIQAVDYLLEMKIFKATLELSKIPSSDDVTKEKVASLLALLLEDNLKDEYPGLTKEELKNMVKGKLKEFFPNLWKMFKIIKQVTDQIWTFVFENPCGYAEFRGLSGSVQQKGIVFQQADDPYIIACFSANPQSASTDYAVNFDASNSVEYLDNIVSYSWTFGDGHTATTTSPQVSHQYTQWGYYKVNLLIESAGGRTATSEMNVTIGNVHLGASCAVEGVVWHNDGSLLVSSIGQFYLLENKKKRWVPSGAIDAVFNSYRFDEDKIILVKQDELNLYPSGPDLPQSSSPPLRKEYGKTAVYRLEYREGNVVKCPIKSDLTFYSWGYRWEDVIEEADLSRYPTTKDYVLFRDGTLLKGSSSSVYVLENGLLRPIESAQMFETLGYTWGNIMEVPDAALEYGVLGNGPMITWSEIMFAHVSKDDIPPVASLADPAEGTYAGSTAMVLDWNMFDNVGATFAEIWGTVDGWLSSFKLNLGNLLEGAPKRVFVLSDTASLPPAMAKVAVSLRQAGIMEVTQTSGTFTWTLPDVDADQAAIRLVGYDEAGNVGYDYTTPEKDRVIQSKIVVVWK